MSDWTIPADIDLFNSLSELNSGVVELGKETVPDSSEAIEESGRTQDAVPAVEVNRKRTLRRTKKETELAVYAAIAIKFSNPDWNETKCAKKAKLHKTTLNGHPLWTEWKSKIEAANCSSSLSKVQREFDKRTGEYLYSDSGIQEE